MTSELNKCPHCGEQVREEFTNEVNVKKHIIIGAITGLLIGCIFDYFYFYIGVITDFFSFMPIVHIIASALLGMLIAWVIGEKKELNAYRKWLAS